MSVNMRTREMTIVLVALVALASVVREARADDVVPFEGAAADSFAASDDWESRGWDTFRAGRRYLLSLTVPAAQHRYEVVEQFCARSKLDFGVAASIDLDPSEFRSDAERDSLRRAVARVWRPGLPLRTAPSSERWSEPAPAAPVTWTLARRDSLLASLREWLGRERELSRPPRPLGKNGIDVRPDWVVAEDAMARIAAIYGSLAEHPDSATREFALRLMTPPWTGLRRALAVELARQDTSVPMRERLAQVVPTGDDVLDFYVARRLAKESVASAHDALVRLARSSKAGSWLEVETFRALRSDTSDAVRALRWKHVRANETDPLRSSRYNRIDNAPSLWDNWDIAFGWTPAEVRAAISDSSERLRIVGARVACARRFGDRALTDRTAAQGPRSARRQPVAAGTNGSRGGACHGEMR